MKKNYELNRFASDLNASEIRQMAIAAGATPARSREGNMKILDSMIDEAGLTGKQAWDALRKLRRKSTTKLDKFFETCVDVELRAMLIERGVDELRQWSRPTMLKIFRALIDEAGLNEKEALSDLRGLRRQVKTVVFEICQK